MNGECESGQGRMNSRQQPHEVPLRGLPAVVRGRGPSRVSTHPHPQLVFLRERTPGIGLSHEAVRATEGSSRPGQGFGVANGRRR